MEYDLHLFIEIIESIQGIQYLRQGEFDDVTCRFYQGLKGNLVMIDVTDESVNENIGSIYLDRLGLNDLIPSLFPKENAPLIIH